MSREDLIPVRTKEEAKKRGRNGGIKSGEARRAKRDMKETARAIMDMKVSDGNITVQTFLDSFGLKKGDRNYQTAVVARLVADAIGNGNTSAARLLAELTGDLNRFQIYGAETEDVEGLVEIPYPQINLPDNGRDKRPDNELAPQAGPQTMFMASKADIVIYGGAAGGGKTYALLLETLRHRNVKLPV